MKRKKSSVVKSPQHFYNKLMGKLWKKKLRATFRTVGLQGPKKKLHPPKETLEWCKSFLGTIKDRVRFLSPGKSVVRDIEAKQTAPIIDLKIHKEVTEKSVFG